MCYSLSIHNFFIHPLLGTELFNFNEIQLINSSFLGCGFDIVEKIFSPILS
jgi:hypothetical protein